MQWRLVFLAGLLTGCSARTPAPPSPTPGRETPDGPTVQSPGPVAAPRSGTSSASPGAVRANSAFVAADRSESATPEALDPPVGIRPGLARLPGYQASVAKPNPRAHDSRSPAQGQSLYVTYCSTCHRVDLSGQGSPLGNLRDLRDATSYKYGTSDQAVFRTLRFGIPRTAMGNYEKVLSEEQVWDLVNYLRSRRRPRPATGS